MVMSPFHVGIVLSKMTRGELDFGPIGNDGSLVGKMVEIFYADTHKWYIGRLSGYNLCKEGDYPQLYIIELQHNGNFIRGTTFSEHLVCLIIDIHIDYVL